MRTNDGSHIWSGNLLWQSKLVPDQPFVDVLCPGPTVAATSGPGELANMDHTFIIRLIMLLAGKGVHKELAEIVYEVHLRFTIWPWSFCRKMKLGRSCRSLSYLLALGK